jgi:phospholipase C
MRRLGWVALAVACSGGCATEACPPDDRPPENQPGMAFDHLGARVPFLVISPFAKHGHVSHPTHDHTSIVRFIEARYVIPLSDRDANAEAPWDMFDFGGAPNLEPQTVPVPAIRAAELDACDAIWER